MKRYIERVSGKAVYAQRFEVSMADGYKVISRSNPISSMPIYLPKKYWKEEYIDNYLILTYFMKDGNRIHEANETDWIIFNDERKYVISQDRFYNEYI